MLLTFRIYIKTYNASTIPEILFPHLQRASPEDTNFQHNRRGITESRKMALIDIKIMDPLVEPLR